MKSNALIFWMAIGLAAIASYGGWTIWRHSQEASATTPSGQSVAEEEAVRMRMNLPADGVPVAAFKLTDQDGKEFNSESLKGKVWVGSIFFASCPGQCYKLNQALAGVQADHSLADVRFVSITCDPTNDTPEVLKQYAARFDANLKQWSFLTGPDDATIQKIGTSVLQVAVEQRAHRDDAVVFDRQSRIRGYYHLADNGEVDKLQKKLAALLAEKAPAEKAPAEKEPPAASSKK